MTLGYLSADRLTEKMDAYRFSIGYIVWFYEIAANLKGFH